MYVSMTSILTVSKKHQKCIQESIHQANQSPCKFKHGCVIYGNGNIYGKGFNNYRNYSCDGLLQQCYTCHAEIAAIRNCIRSRRIKVVHR